MKKLWLPLIVCILGSHVVSWFAPWWVVGIICMLVSVVWIKKESQAFFLTFFSIFLLWLLMGLYFDILNEGRLSARIGTLFSGVNKYFLIIVSAVIGGLWGGLCGWIGTLVKNKFILVK